jgi:hypothetical protein
LRFLALVCLLATGLVTGPRAAEPCTAEPVVLGKAFVPSAARRHGEVRLIALPPCSQAGCVTCRCVRVESVLFSTMLARGIHRIRQEESRAWPEGSAHHADSVRYLAALDAAAATVLGPDAGPVDVNQPVQGGAVVRRLAIAFENNPRSSHIEISSVELGPTDGEGPVCILSSNVLQRLEVSHEYLRASFVLMLRNALELEPDAAEALLADARSRAGLLKKE